MKKLLFSMLILSLTSAICFAGGGGKTGCPVSGAKASTATSSSKGTLQKMSDSINEWDATKDQAKCSTLRNNPDEVQKRRRGSW